MATRSPAFTEAPRARKSAPWVPGVMISSSAAETGRPVKVASFRATCSRSGAAPRYSVLAGDEGVERPRGGRERVVVDVTMGEVDRCARQRLTLERAAGRAVPLSY